ncbi:MAG TPA: MerR family transcriptional regulator [Pseudonocardiaceae bacterium]|nr:MerR family transcriptional regulator [Pseudonocardiaceae bacterium]
MTRPQGSTTDKLDDADYPAYTIGLAADLLGVQPAFLRSLDAAGLLTPDRSAGGQRRYSRAELTLATRVRELLDQNMPLTAATRIVSLEHQLAAAHQRITQLEQTTSQPTSDPSKR